MELKYNIAKTWGEDEAGHGGHGGHGGGQLGAGSEWQQSPRDPPPHYHKAS